MARRVIVEADGGSRGNPGPAGFGAVLKDADTGSVIAEDGETIGVATNNVAEYRGLIAGLMLARDHAPGATVEVRMDSKLVVEQMSGRWKIKHPDMKPLAAQAQRLAPAGTRYTWVPRAQNAHADKLANQALDGAASGVRLRAGATATATGATGGVAGEESDSLIAELEAESSPAPARGWSGADGAPTTLVVVRHGVTVHTAAKRFSGGLGGDNPPLSDDGRGQIRATGAWLAPLAGTVSAVIASPVRRTRESGDLLAEALGGVPVEEEPGFAEMEFGHWDGLTFGEVATQHPDELDAWLGSLDVAPFGGESFREVQTRVLAGLERVKSRHAGRTVVVASHVTPIKTLVAHAMDAPLDAVFRMELSPASVTVLTYFDHAPTGRRGPNASLRLYNALPPGRDAFSGGLW